MATLVQEIGGHLPYIFFLNLACIVLQVTEYPSLQLFNDGKKMADYRGDKTLGAFNDFLEFQQAEINKHEHEEL